jgi:hypothetical protein
MAIELAPGEVRSIIYRVKATGNGKFTNLAHVDAHFASGQGSTSVDASADIVISSMSAKTEKSKTDSSCMEINCTNEPAYNYSWNQEPIAGCSGPCPIFSETFEEDLS